MTSSTFHLRPTSGRPLNLTAFAATGTARWLRRRAGRSGLRVLRRLTGDSLASQLLLARSEAGSLLFPALDTYAHELIGEPAYEPEVRALLWVLRHERYAFVDGGAHLGFWAVQVSSDAFGRHPCVAVEASTETFALLERNRQVNGNRFVGLHAALHRRSGQILAFDETPGSEARHLLEAGAGGASVLSISVDDLVARFWGEEPVVIVKLDLEGGEPEALRGTARTREGHDCLFIVEDHGGDVDHRSAAAALGEGLGLWSLGATGTATPMADLDAVARVKLRPDRGYNFLACAPSSPLGLRLGLTAAAQRSGAPVTLALTSAVTP